MKRFLFLVATAAALMFSGCETPNDGNDGNDNNQSNNENVDDNKDNENNNNDDKNDNKDENNEEDKKPEILNDLVGTSWSTTIEYFDDATNMLEEVETARITFKTSSEAMLYSEFRNADNTITDNQTFPATYTYSTPNVVIYYTVDYGDEEGIVNYTLSGKIDGDTMTLSRTDNSEDDYDKDSTLTFTREK